jgi:hypothetical protein
MWSDIDIDPRDIDARAVVNSNSTQKGRKVSDAIGGVDGKQDNIANDAEDIGEQDELQPVSQVMSRSRRGKLTGDRNRSLSEKMAATTKAIAPKMYTGTVR